MDRFETHLGTNYNPEWISSLTDEELAEEIRAFPEWDADLCRDLCWRANLLKDFLEAEDFSPVVQAAAEKLGVDIG